MLAKLSCFRHEVLLIITKNLIRLALLDFCSYLVGTGINLREPKGLKALVIISDKARLKQDT